MSKIVKVLLVILAADAAYNVWRMLHPLHIGNDDERAAGHAGTG